ncbi:hypothetical protein PFISCL1PPCAC_17358, partial [Pristionchus fissidentatus]
LRSSLCQSLNFAMTPFRYVNGCIESHCRPLYACSFNPYTCPQFPLHIAVAGINHVSIYEITNGTDFYPKLTICDPALTPHDDCTGEADRSSATKANRFYAVNWLYDTRDDKLMVVFGGDNGLIRIVNASTAEEVQIHSGHGNVVNEIRVHPVKFTIYASASKDMTIRIWSSRCQTALVVVAGFDGHRDQILSCDWSVCGNYIASGSMDHTVRLWKVTEKMHERDAEKRDRSFEEFDEPFKAAVESSFACAQVASTGDMHTNYVDCVRFFGQFLFTKSSENDLVISKFGDFEDGVAGCRITADTANETSISQLSHLRIPNGDTWFLKFDIDPRKEWLLVGDRTGKIHAWHLTPARLPSADPDCTIEMPGMLPSAIRQIAFDPHGKLVACVSDHATIVILKRTDWTPENDRTQGSPSPSSV